VAGNFVFGARWRLVDIFHAVLRYNDRPLASAEEIDLIATFTPGSGPVVLSKAMPPFAPVPFMRKSGANLTLVETTTAAKGAHPFGRLTAFHGQTGIFVRSLPYMLLHGADGMRMAKDDAALKANNVRAGLRDMLTPPFGDKASMHEVLFDDSWLKDTGVTTLDFAKAMVDAGYHPMTMYFPLVVHGAMLIEPTESESRAALDKFIHSLRGLAGAAKSGDKSRFTKAPHFAPRRRMNETKAAREPKLRSKPAAPEQQAAE
jgi:glycine dehydrogenase subunit 2